MTGVQTCALPISNLFLLAITSISIALYPSIKRLDLINQGKQYVKIRQSLIIVTPFILILYFPAWYVISLFIPKYNLVLEYLNLLFIFCIFQSKMQILLNLFYKIRREESKLLYANVETLMLSILFMIIASFTYNSVYFVVCSFVLASIIRTVRSELYFNKEYLVSNYTIYNNIIICFVFYILTEFFYGRMAL